MLGAQVPKPYSVRRHCLKTKEAPGEVGPGPQPPPSANLLSPAPLRPRSPCAHEQRRLPRFLPRRNFLIPFFGPVGCQEPLERSPSRVRRTKYLSDLTPLLGPAPASVGAAGNGKAPLLSPNICLFPPLPLQKGRHEEKTGSLPAASSFPCRVPSPARTGHGAAPGVRLWCPR